MIITMTALREIRAGELVTTIDVVPYKPTMAEHLARREWALDLRARWRQLGDEATPRECLDEASTRITLKKDDIWKPPPRNKTPLPLP